MDPIQRQLASELVEAVKHLDITLRTAILVLHRSILLCTMALIRGEEPHASAFTVEMEKCIETAMPLFEVPPKETDDG